MMTLRSSRSRYALLASLFLLTSCAKDHLPTELEVERTTPVPAAPPPGQPPAPSGPSAGGGDNRRSFVWTEAGGYTILPNPPGVVLVSASGINAKGEVAGTLIMGAAAGLPIYRGFKWSVEKGFTYIVTPGGLNTYVSGIDDHGSVVGYTEGPQNPYGREREAFIWNETDGPRRLGVPVPYLNVLGLRNGIVFGNTRGGAFRLRLPEGRVEMLPTVSEVGGGVLDINDDGDAVGFDGYIDHGFGGTSDAVIWDRAGNRTTAYDCKGEEDCFAHLAAINSIGTAAGVVTRGEHADIRVFRWSRGKGLEFLDIPRAGYGTGVAGVNDDGSIIAQNGREAFIVSPTGALTAIRPPDTHQLVQPRAMNRRGQVVGMLF